jgi:hypothetical protein
MSTRQKRVRGGLDECLVDELIPHGRPLRIHNSLLSNVGKCFRFLHCEIGNDNFNEREAFRKRSAGLDCNESLVGPHGVTHQATSTSEYHDLTGEFTKV